MPDIDTYHAHAPLPPRRLPPRTSAQMRADSATVAPLFAYLEAHCIVPVWAASRAAIRNGETMTRSRLHHIRRGAARIPAWFIAGVCREIGQPIETVMGEEWRRVSELPTPSDDQQKRAS